MNTIRDHLNEVRENIQKACEKAGGYPDRGEQDQTAFHAGRSV